MTSEIALMNRHAIALAADSAITVTYFRDGEKKERYFKGSNKIFNLSAHQPVALMINATADLHGIPWEIIAKTYREQLGGTRHTHLGDYAKDFFHFIENNQDLYPKEFQKQQFISDVLTTASIVLAIVDARVKAQKQDEEEPAPARIALILSEFQQIKQNILDAKALCEIPQEDISTAVVQHREEIAQVLLQSESHQKFRDAIPTIQLSEASIIGLHKALFSPLFYTTTELVIAGFGTKDFFPQLEIHKCHGTIFGRTLNDRTETKAISHHNASEVIPLAQSDMAKTFMNGISAGAIEEMEKGVRQTLIQFENDLKAANIVAPEADLSQKRTELMNSLGDGLISRFSSSHTMPMKRVVGMLPVDELAELAEILIRIESLKERVTRETEQVGGPIDVAVLSKGDGFIWIKRKHYFKEELNPRYFARKGVHDHDDLPLNFHPLAIRASAVDTPFGAG